MQDSDEVTVSRPANISRNTILMRSASASGCPSTSDLIRLAMMSSSCSALRRLSARNPTKYSRILAPAAAMLALTSSAVSPSGWMMPWLNSNRKSRSSIGAPMSRRNVRHGNGTQNSWYSSDRPTGAICSSRSAARVRTCASSSRTFFGANIGSSRRRHFLCSWPSMSNGISGTPPLSNGPRPPVPNTAGWLLMRRMSSRRYRCRAPSNCSARTLLALS